MFGLGWVCLTFVFFTALAVVSSYWIAVYKGHVYPFLPAISDCGVLNPEAVIFREMINLAGFLFLATCYVRYMQYQLMSVSHWDEKQHKKLDKLNKATFGFGICSGVAITIVANFKSEIKTISIHDYGAMTAFVCALIYCWLQCFMTYRLCDFGVTKLVIFRTRVFLALSVTLCLLIFLLGETYANIQWDIERPRYSQNAKLYWRPSDPGYFLHLLSNLGEWAMALSFLIYIGTFLPEFQQISITSDFRSECCDND